MKFNIKARNSSGELYEREVEAPDRFAVFRQLKKEGDEDLLSLKEVAPSKIFSSNIISNFFGRISTHEKIMLYKNFGSMLKAGLPISRALEIMEKQTKNKKLKEVIGKLLDYIQKGTSLHEAMSNFPKVFNALAISMVKVGEEGGKLSESLESISLQLERVYFIQRKVRGAMIYPLIIISVMIVIGILMLILVVPDLVKTFNELHADLPLSTKIVIWLSDFMKSHYIIGIGIAVIFGMIIKFVWKIDMVRHIFDNLILHMPIIGTLVKEINISRITRTLSSLLSAGIDLVLATEISSEVVQNSYYKESLKQAQAYIQKGETVSSVFAAKEFLYPSFVSEMISVGEETGQLSHMLLETTLFYEDEVEQKTKDMSTIVEPFLMVIIGIVVGFFAYSMITPMYTVLNNI